MTEPEGWPPPPDRAGELDRVIAHARLCLADADHQLAHLDGVLAAGAAALLPESLVYFTTERDVAQYRRNLWGAKVDQLVAYAESLTVES